MRNAITTTKSLVRFNSEEVLMIFLYAILIGFIFSFRSWGDPFSYIVGLSNWLYFGALGFIVTLSIIFIQKVIGAHSGIIPTFRITSIYFIISLVIVFLTSGLITFFLPPGFTTSENKRMMLGRTRYKEAFSDYLRLGFGGIVACVFLGIFFSFAFFPERLMALSSLFFLYAFYSLIPIDLLLSWQDKTTGVSNGMAILYPSRSTYVFCLVFIFAGYILSYTRTIFFSIIFSILIALFVSIMWFLKKEK